MAQFKPVFTLDVAHAFFADGRCTQLHFVPSPSAERLLYRYQLLMRNGDTGFSLIADVDNWIEPDDDSILRFNVYAKDNYFGFYTAETEGLLTPLYVDAKNITADNTSLVIQRDAPPQLANEHAVRAKPGMRTPILVIDIDLKDEVIVSAREHDAVKRLLKFSTRELYWKYYFFGELASMELDIQDVSSQTMIGFDLSDEPVAKNGKAFISQLPIAMSNEPKQRFQLKDKNNSGKILIRRLPNAGINLVSKSRNLKGQQILVAEIYVNQ